jgi:hypothetical protein
MGHPMRFLRRGASLVQASADTEDLLRLQCRKAGGAELCSGSLGRGLLDGECGEEIGGAEMAEMTDLALKLVFGAFVRFCTGRSHVTCTTLPPPVREGTVQHQPNHEDMRSTEHKYVFPKGLPVNMSWQRG